MAPINLRRLHAEQLLLSGNSSPIEAIVWSGHQPDEEEYFDEQIFVYLKSLRIHNVKQVVALVEDENAPVNYYMGRQIRRRLQELGFYL